MKITFKKLVDIISDNIIHDLENNEGLIIFAKNRSKFEGWFKVKIYEILSKYFSIDKIIPEKDRIDIVFEDWAIELKIIKY